MKEGPKCATALWQKHGEAGGSLHATGETFDRHAKLQTQAFSPPIQDRAAPERGPRSPPGDHLS
jgi:hypothetical protein